MTEQEYLAVIGQKTAALFQEACYMGACLAGGSSRECLTAADFGYHIGTAYQIMDDLLDVAGDGETMCKTLGTDLRSAKPTLPLIHALCVLPAAERTALLRKLRAHAASDGELFEVLAASGSVGYVLRRLRERADEAVETLRPLRRSRMKTALLAVPEWIMRQAREGLAADSNSVYTRHHAYAGRVRILKCPDQSTSVPSEFVQFVGSGSAHAPRLPGCSGTEHHDRTGGVS
jgi:octaprenyl-diphosphate synthase